MIDIERLREDLINYFGTAIYYNPVAIIELEEVKRASDDKLKQIALENGFNPDKYKVKER